MTGYCAGCGSDTFENGFLDADRIIGRHVISIAFVPAIVCLACNKSYLEESERILLNIFARDLAMHSTKFRVHTDWFSLKESFETRNRLL